MAFGLCAAAQNDEFLLQEDFSNGQQGPIPAGWQAVNLDNLPNDASFTMINNTWQHISLDPSYTQRCIASACGQITDQSQMSNRWLITPRIFVPASGYELTFKLKDIAGAGYQALQLMVSTGNDQPGTFVLKRDIQSSEIVGDWSEFTVSLSQYAGDSIYVAFVNRGQAYAIALDDVDIHVVPEHEIGLRSVSASPALVPAGDESTISITVRNGGSQPITDFTVNVKYDGSEEEYDVSGVNIQQGQSYTFNHQNPVSVGSDTNIFVVVSVRLNDTINEFDTENNTDSVMVQFYDPSNMVENKGSLLEHMTTAQCSNCPRVDQQLDQVMPQFAGRVVTVEHHVGYYTDDLTISASDDMLGYYNSSQVFAPALMIDRSYAIATMYAASDGPIFSVGDNNSLIGQLNAALNTPSFVDLSISNVDYDAQTRVLNVTVSGQINRNMQMVNPSLAVFLTEDSVMASHQAGGSSPYRHDHVIRATLSSNDVFGDMSAIGSTVAGTTFSRTYTYTLPTNLRANRCHVVAFVAEVSNDATANMVHNAKESAALLAGPDPTTTGITATEASISIKTWPNPAVETAYISAENTILAIEVVNAMGQMVYANGSVNADVFEMDVRQMVAGTYFVRVATANGTATKRLVVK